MNNDMKDKQYLALELTKILYGDNTELTNEGIFTSYESFLKKLTGLHDEIETTQALRNQIKYLQEENDRLKTDKQAVLKPLISDITTIVNGCRGDMEPYVYEALLSNCRKYEK